MIDFSKHLKPPYRVQSMREIERLPWNGRKVVSTFSGCGGSCLGYRMAGYKVVWANEFIPEAQNTYKANHPNSHLCTTDIREVTPEQIIEESGIPYGEIDIFDGSPPCKDFSMAGKRDWESGAVKKYSDTKQRTDDLFDHYIRLVGGTQPKVFVAENVKGLTIGAAKDVLGSFQDDMFDNQDDTIIRKFMAIGYAVGYRVLDAADLGVPQTRKRIIFVGIRKDLAITYALKPTWPAPLKHRYTVRDAIPWIARVYDGKESSVSADDGPSPTILASDGKRPTSSFDQGLGYVEPESDISKYCTGAEWDKLEVGQQSEKYFSEVKVDPDGPCPTICASHGSGGIASTVHPYEKRKFSIAELRRICGFPDDFLLTGTYAKQWERLGRSVPPLMMMRIASNLRHEIFTKIKQYGL